MKITKDMKIDEVIKNHPETLAVFMKHELECLGCLALSTETVEQGALMHNLDIETLLEELNEACSSES